MLISGDNINNTFTNYLQASNDIIFKTNSIYYASIGIGVERYVKIIITSLSIGLDLKYSIPFNKITWSNNNDNEVLDFPDTKVSGFEFGAIIRWEFDFKIKRNKRKRFGK
ncbi:MAG: hypothetical protein JXR51_05020 [Bacteroidales bacterium]|nr:hypothetical protein [Bacteroidales bacterium]MBN2756521.1 hypothetical protein [Bacteroidales bacterium]